MMEYDKEELTQTISTEELIRHFRNEEEVSGYCRECENFGITFECCTRVDSTGTQTD